MFGEPDLKLYVKFTDEKCFYFFMLQVYNHFYCIASIDFQLKLKFFMLTAISLTYNFYLWIFFSRRITSTSGSASITIEVTSSVPTDFGRCFTVNIHKIIPRVPSTRDTITSDTYTIIRDYKNRFFIKISIHNIANVAFLLN